VTQPLRWLICGGWEFVQYEAACAAALERLGQTAIPFRWSPFFAGIGGRVERKWTIAGPATRRMNAALLAAVRETEPNVVLVWRGTHVLARTIDAIRATSSPTLVSYNNDDPFSPVYSRGPLHQRRLWRVFRPAIPHYDLQLVYRPANVAEMIAAGARAAHLLPPYFIPDIDRPVEPTPSERSHYECDVIFIGHYEADGRLEHLKALVAGGARVKVFGTNWPKHALAALEIEHRDARPVMGNEYRAALCSARMALCFLSRLNRDVYTRRVFEITACGVMLLSERTPELEHLFADGREAVYFSSSEELVRRVRSLLASPGEIERIAAAGLQRVHMDGHSVDARMARLLTLVEPKAATGPVSGVVVA
jgi:hypothetical protein